MNANIILVGMPASGKSTIGALLAEKLNYIFIDTDTLIEKTNGLSISDIFKQYSEDYFRKLEYDIIKLVCSNGYNKIISVGGGAFENPDSRSTLLNFGKVFYLKSDLDVLYCRVKNDSSRPLLNNENPKEILEKLLNKREENFLKAHYVINTSDLDENQVIEKILGSINEANP